MILSERRLFNMGKYVQSELIKNKRSFAVKMLIIMPCVTIILAMVMMMGNYVQVLAYNWWYLIFLPFVVSYVSGHLISREKKKNFHGLFGLLERKQDLGYGKVIAVTFYLIITNCVFSILISLAGSVFQRQISVMDNLLASFVLTLTFAWQIPFVLILALKINTTIAVMINVACNLIIACSCATKVGWWIPFAIPARMMCIILGILPNGLMAADAGLLGDYTAIIYGILITLVVYVVMTVCLGRILLKQEA